MGARIVLCFPGIHAALAAEKAATARFPVDAPRLEPLPPGIASDCGYGLFIEGASDLNDPRAARLLASDIRIAAAYRELPGSGKESHYERIG